MKNVFFSSRGYLKPTIPFFFLNRIVQHKQIDSSVCTIEGCRRMEMIEINGNQYKRKNSI